MVVAKGGDNLALMIRSHARASGVPCIEVPLLARTLHKWVEIGEPVPEALFDALAAVLAYVYQLRAAYKGLADSPTLPDIEVPDAYSVPPSEPSF